MKYLEYEANAGLGIIFPSKTFIVEDEEKVFIISPSPSVLNDEKIKSTLQENLFFIAPNNFHNLHLFAMKESFPNANFYGPKRAMKQSGVTLKPFKELPQSKMKVKELKGCKATGEALFYLPETGELIITDLIFNMRHEMNFATKMAMKMVGTYNQIGTSRLFKSGINDKTKFKEFLSELLELNIDKVYVNHGDALDPNEFEGQIRSLIG